MNAYVKIISVLSLIAVLFCVCVVVTDHNNLFATDEPELIIEWDSTNKTLTLKLDDISKTKVLPDYDSSDYSTRLWQTVDGVNMAENAENLVIGTGITKIGSYNFYEFTALRTVSIQYTCTEFGDYAFGKSSFETFNIPAGLKKVGVAPFYWCPNLSSFSVDANNTYFEEKDGVLFQIKADNGVGDAQTINTLIQYPMKHHGDVWQSSSDGVSTGYYVVPYGTLKIADFAFFKNEYLHYIYLTEKINEIGISAFQECTKITGIYMPNSINTLGQNAFYGCSKLVAVCFGNKSLSVPSGCFVGTHLRLVAAGITSVTSYRITFEAGSLPQDRDEVGYWKYLSGYADSKYTWSTFEGSSGTFVLTNAQVIQNNIDDYGEVDVYGTGMQSYKIIFNNEYLPEDTPLNDINTSTKRMVVTGGTSTDLSRVVILCYADVYMMQDGVTSNEGESQQRSTDAHQIIWPATITALRLVTGWFPLDECFIIYIPASVTSVSYPWWYMNNLRAVIVSEDNTVYETINGGVYGKANHILYKTGSGKYVAFDEELRGISWGFRNNVIDCVEITTDITDPSMFQVGAEVVKLPSSVTGGMNRDQNMQYSSFGFLYDLSSRFSLYEYMDDLDYYYAGTAKNMGKYAEDYLGVTTTTARTMYHNKAVVPPTSTTVNLGGENVTFQYYHFQCTNTPTLYKLIPEYTRSLGTHTANILFIRDNGTHTIPDFTLSGDCSYAKAPWSSLIMNGQVDYIILEETITKIGDYAFYNPDTDENGYPITHVKGTLLPNSLNSIGHRTFANLGILSLNLPSTLETLETDSFMGCTKLEHIRVVNNDNFSSKGGLLYDSDFSYILLIPSAMKGTLNIEQNSVIGLSDYAAYGSSLSYISLNSINSIGEYSFAHSSLKSIKLNTAGTFVVKEHAFYDSDDLETIDLTGSGSIILREYAFNNCDGLKSLTIGNAVTRTFESYSIPATVGGEHWFKRGTMEMTMLTDTDLSALVKGFTYTVGPSGATAHYIGNDVWYIWDEEGRMLDIFVEVSGTVPVSDVGRMTIPDQGWPWSSYANNISRLVVEDKVIYIDSYAFQGLSAINSFSGPAELISIGDYVFQGCTSLGTMDSSGLQSIGEGSFKDCISLTSVALSSLNSVGPYAFSGCKELSRLNSASEDLIDLSGVTTVGAYSFEKCISIVAADISDVESATVPEGMFKGCTSLTEVDWPDGNIIVGDYAFSKCNLAISNTEINGFFEKLSTVGKAAFEGNSGIVSTASSKTIEDSDLDHIILSHAIAVDKNAFMGCSISAVTVTSGGTASSFALNAFGSSGLWVTVTYPGGERGPEQYSAEVLREAGIYEITKPTASYVLMDTDDDDKIDTLIIAKNTFFTTPSAKTAVNAVASTLKNIVYATEVTKFEAVSTVPLSQDVTIKVNSNQVTTTTATPLSLFNNGAELFFTDSGLIYTMDNYVSNFTPVFNSTVLDSKLTADVIASGSYVFLSDVQVSDMIIFPNEDTTIDLFGHNISRSSGDIFYIPHNYPAIIIDSSDSKEGKMISGGYEAAWYDWKNVRTPDKAVYVDCRTTSHSEYHRQMTGMLTPYWENDMISLEPDEVFLCWGEDEDTVTKMVPDQCLAEDGGAYYTIDGLSNNVTSGQEYIIAYLFTSDKSYRSSFTA